jgi:hypothetical protein
MINSKAYKLLVLVAVVLLAFLNSVTRGIACKGNGVGILV